MIIQGAMINRITMGNEYACMRREKAILIGSVYTACVYLANLHKKTIKAIPSSKSCVHIDYTLRGNIYPQCVCVCVSVCHINGPVGYFCVVPQAVMHMAVMKLIFLSNNSVLSLVQGNV